MQQDEDSPRTTLSELARSVSDPDFLGALCHDLRGPLGAIGTWIHVLGSGRADTVTQQRALAAMQRDVTTQTRLVEQLADLSSILGGTLVLSTEELDLLSLVEELGAELQARPSPPRVFADPVRLRQLLAILLPATGGSPAVLRPVVTVDHTSPGALRIRGIARKGSPGLVGLTLARALAAAQGGRLTISSAAEGTAFAIELPAPVG